MPDLYELDEEEIAFLLDASENTFQQLQSRIDFISKLAPDRIEVIKVLKKMIANRRARQGAPP